MKIKILIALSLCLMLTGSIAYANVSIEVRVGFPDDGVYTDLAVGLDISNISFLANAVEASVNAKTEKHTYISGEVGYGFGKIIPFVSLANVKAENSQTMTSDSCLGVGVRGKYDLGKVVVDASGRAFEFQDKINTLLKADFKYRVGDNSFLSVGYTRWDMKSDNLFSGFGFGLKMSF